MTKKLLIAPLDWGLGHATRCIPIIRSALELQIPVILAASGRSKTLLQNEFPDLEMIDFEGYDIRYPKNEHMNVSMAWQAPKILAKIEKEHQRLEKIVADNAIGAIISDNRYGLYHKNVYSVFMTHQLYIQADGMTLIETILRKMNHRMIRRFDELWVPDFEGVPNLSGKLGHPPLNNVPTYYLGALSRFTSVAKSAETFPEIVVVISGPEPQRTLFEEKVTTQLSETPHSALIVCGTPEKQIQEQISDNILKISHLETKKLADYLAHTSLVIARPGYSTLMDLSVFGKNVLLVPTPGQTEQEFLARQLTKSGQCFSVSQQAMNLTNDLPKTKNFSGLPLFLSDQSMLKERLMWIREKMQ